MDKLVKTLSSGAKLEVTLASFPEGHRLFKAATKEIESLDLEKDTVQKVSCRILTSQEVEDALIPCMGRATYDGKKVNSDLFENAKIREDYLEVAKEVIGFNLRPFSKGIGFALWTIIKKSIDIQE